MLILGVAPSPPLLLKEIGEKETQNVHIVLPFNGE